MKSNVKRSVKKESDKIILSIGMIVKNEEKHLDKCLSALQKLRDHVPNELIIVDTGSTDRTKEIALKYTDKVYDFEWIDDFAAARNFGLKKAVGEWFMFVDADEYLDEDCDEMIKFFNIPEVRNKYNSASYKIINYDSEFSKNGDIFLGSRLVRLLEGVEFKGAIHEFLPQPPPHGIFTTVFHHYGYAHESRKSKIEKAKRNGKHIIEEYEKNPTDLRALSHVCDLSYGTYHFKTFEEREKVHKEYLAAAEKNVLKPFAHSAFLTNTRFYYVHGMYNKSLEITDRFLKLEGASGTISELSIYYLRSLIFIDSGNYIEAYKAILKYFELYKKYQNNELEIAEMRFSNINGITENDYEGTILSMAKVLVNLERFDEALEYLNKSDLPNLDFARLKYLLNVYREILRKTHNYSYIINIYKAVYDLGDYDKIALVLYLMEQYYMEFFGERERFVNAIADSGVKGDYIELMKLVRDEKNEVDISEKLNDFINNISRWDVGYSEALYLAMKHKLDISETIKKLSHNVLKELISTMSSGHFEFAEVALGYCENVDISTSIRMMLWGVSVLESAVGRSNELDDERKPELYDLFICTLSDYIYNIYNEELLNPEDVEVLPELHRFGYYMTLAFIAKDNGYDVAYVKALKSALELCEPMRALVSYYLNAFEREVKSGE